jgi:hypothetical protein
MVADAPPADHACPAARRPLVAWKLLPKPACSRWVLRWHLDKECSAAAMCTVPTIALDFEMGGRSHHRYAEMHFTTTRAAHGQQRSTGGSG